MNLVVPVPSQDPGPDWAQLIVGDMSAIDSHNHTPGKGVTVPVDGLNINADLPFGGNSAILLKSTRFSVQGSPLAGATDLGCLYVSGVDLYYNDENGTQIRITTGGNVNAGAGSITGLPSGTAGVSYSSLTGTYTFQSATSTGATISAGPIAIGSTTASAKHTTLASNASQAADLTLTLPVVAPTSNTVLASDNAGNTFWDSVTGTGAIVRTVSPTITTPTISGGSVTSTTLNTCNIVSPTFSGTPAGNILGGTYSPTVTAGGSGTGQAAVAAFFYQRIGNIVTASGWLTGTPSGGGALSMSVSVPVAPTSNFSFATDVSGAISGAEQTSGSLTTDFLAANVGAKTVHIILTFSVAPGAISFPITFIYSCA